MLEELFETRVRALAEAFSRSGLELIRVADGDTEIEMRRTEREAPAAPAAAGQVADDPIEREANYDVLTADLVGRVRFARPPATVGTQVDADRELASIEALGIRNPIRARTAGRVAVVYVEEGQAVDYGAPLFAIERA